MFSKARLFAALSVLLTASAHLSAAEAQTSQDNAPNKVSTIEQKELQQADILKVSEAFGHFIGRNLNSPGVKFDLESIIKGMREGAAGKPAPMSDKEYEEMMTLLQEKAMNALATTNLKAADEYLEKNVKEKGVIEAVPGKLQYTILEEGTGPVVTQHTTPKINYTGRYIDGTVFGSSEDVGGPIAVPLDQTIPGFSEGIVGMKEGEKRRLYVHPELGYGTTGHLSPNALLIFDIEVVKATSPEQSQGDEEDDELPPLALAEEKEEDSGDDSMEDDSKTRSK